MKNIQKHLEEQNIIPFLQLAHKDGDRVTGTGPHKVIILDATEGQRKNPRTGKIEQCFNLLVEEDGQQKKYVVPAKDEKTGEPHYLLMRLADIKEGAEVVLEYKKREGSFMGYIDVRPTLEDISIPIIEGDPIDGNNQELSKKSPGDSPGISTSQQDSTTPDSQNPKDFNWEVGV